MGVRRFVLLFLACLSVAPAFAQDKLLTLDDALRLAKERNGTVIAALYEISAAQSVVGQNRAAFLPKITPIYQYNSDRSSAIGLSGDKVFRQTEGSTTYVNATWRVLDSGQRQLAFLSSRRLEEASTLSATQTLRTTLYGVVTQYVESLRSQELLSVNQAQVQRAYVILDQTKAQVKVGEIAAKEVLQAQADALNAQVSYLTAKNRSSNAVAGLRSVIGWDLAQPLPPLATLGEPKPIVLPPLVATVAQGVERRADLRSARMSVEALNYSRKQAERNAGPTGTLDASFDKTLTPDSLESRAMTFTVSAPFFDGGLSREQARQARFQYLASQATYLQQERQAKAEIESIYATVAQDLERIKAAASSREAAQANYKAASESQKAGASNIIDVLTAQVSLVTAESNYIEALYDYLIAEANFKLVTGQPMPGEGKA